MKLMPCDWLCRLDDVNLNQYLSKEEVASLIKNRVNQATNEQLYQVVRSFPSGQEIHSGDLLKMGRIKFFVREMCTSGHKVKADSNNLFYKNDFNCQIFSPLNDDHCMTCRTCLDEHNSYDNPLLSLCKCNGSVQQIHVNCLKQWLKSKLHIKKSENSATYNYKNFACELCTMPYPKSLKYLNSKSNTIITDLLEYDDVQLGSNYIVLETLNKENNLTGALHLLVFDQVKKEVAIGRGSESHVRISDISVSRTHGIIELRDGKVQVRDNKSKFGTLVRMNRPITFSSGDDRSQLQQGRTILGISSNKYIPFSDILNNSKLITDKENQRNNAQNSNQVVLTNPINPNQNRDNNLNPANMYIQLENHYTHNVMVGNMNATDLEQNMIQFNNNNNNIPNSNIGNNTDNTNNNHDNNYGNIY